MRGLFGLAPFRHLRIDQRLHERMQMLKHRGDRQEQMKLDAPVPHFHQRAFERAAAEQRRIGVEPLEIPADGDRLRDRRAVVEQERGEALHRVDGGIGVGAVLARARCPPAPWES